MGTRHTFGGSVSFEIVRTDVTIKSGQSYFIGIFHVFINMLKGI